MNTTIDEFLAVLQSDPQKRLELEEKMKMLSDERFEKRDKGIYRGEDTSPIQIAKNREELASMTQRRFNDSRKFQLYQLYSAYTAKEHSRKIMPHATDEKSVRRVVGEKAGRGFINQDNLFLDSDDIQAVESVAGLIEKKGYYDAIAISEISIHQLSTIIDEIIACNKILNEERSKPISIGSMVNETNVAKRSIGKALEFNVFGIEDYSLTAKEMYTRKKWIITRIMAMLKRNKGTLTLGKMPLYEENEGREEYE